MAERPPPVDRPTPAQLLAANIKTAVDNFHRKTGARPTHVRIWWTDVSGMDEHSITLGDIDISYESGTQDG